MLTSRERVLCALDRKEPDRVPIFCGTSGATTMMAAAYDRLKGYLGIQGETQVFWRAFRLIELDIERSLRNHDLGLSGGLSENQHRKAAYA